MNAKSTVGLSSCLDSQLWLPVGAALGTGIGSLIHDVSFGIAIGLMVGSVATIVIERKKATSRLIVTVGIVALVVTIGTEIILRA
jgi:F0F1-type ATP synthase membrane subunit c/vacuolar-type H+-ATPase subunit K